MDPDSERDGPASRSPEGDPLERVYMERCRQLIDGLDLRDRCAVRVEKDGHWFVLRGTVDSHRTRTALICMVPEIDGASWVVDHLRVVDAC